MPPPDVTSHVQILQHAAHHVQHNELSPQTKTRLSTALSHLTHTLRTLHSTPAPPPPPAHLPHILHQAVPPLLSLFTSSLHTYPLNKDVTHQTLLVLSSFYTTLLPKRPPILSAIPTCFYTLASAGRKQDVRPLLNALLLIASTSPPANPPPVWSPLRVLQAPSARVPATHPLVVVLHTMLEGWLVGEGSIRHWPSVYFLDVSEAVSVALAIKLDLSAKQLSRADLFVSQIRDTFGKLISVSTGPAPRLIQFAFSSGILRALQLSASPLHLEFRDDISQFMRALLVQKLSLFKGLHERHSLLAFTEDDTDTITMVFLTLRVPRSITPALDVDHLCTFCAIIRKLVASVADFDPSAGKNLPLFHRQLLWCIKNSSIMLGAAYATLADAASAADVSFLRSLTSRYPNDGTITRFVSAAALKWHATPVVAAELIDMLSFLSHKTTAVFKLAFPRLVSISSSDIEVTTSLAGLLFVLLEEPRLDVQQDRILFLVDAVRLSLAEEQTIPSKSLPSRESLNNCATHSHDPATLDFWVMFVRRLQQSLEARLDDDLYCSKCIMCLSQVLSSHDPNLHRAQTHLITTFPPFLLQSYLLPTSPPQNKRILQVATIFDVVADRHTDHSTIQQFLGTILDSALIVNDTQQRLIAVFLLRFLSRCDISLFGLVSEGVSRFIGPDPKRKLFFLPLARFAVLGMDMLRKNKSIVWLFTLFRDVSGVAKTPNIEAPKVDLLAKI